MVKRIQGMPLGNGNATSPHTVGDMESMVEFTAGGSVTCTLEGGATTTTTVLAGSRYAIIPGVTTITFGGTFSVG